MLALNRCGAGLAPIDPNLPVERLKIIMDQLKSQVALVSAQHRDLIQPYVESLVVVDETTIASLAGSGMTQSEEKHSCDIGKHPGYCIFTSGSSGTPKGCLISQHAFTAVAAQASMFDIHQGTRVLQFASYAVAISLFEIFATLAAGGTVCIPSEDSRHNNLPGVMQEMRIEWALLTPTTLSVLEPSAAPSLRRLHVAGEAITASLLRTWASAVSVFQVYGMTETSGLRFVSRRLYSAAEAKNIGRPCNARYWVVSPDDHTQLVPIGGIGELLLEGPTLANGYLHLPEQTAQAFRPSPPWRREFYPPIASSQDILYCTGDLVFCNSDGSLSYIGRKDQQVKLRGQRLELAEVEYQVAQHFGSTKERGASPKVVVKVVSSTDESTGGERKGLVAMIVMPTCTSDGSWIGPVTESFQQRARKTMELMQDHVANYMIPRVYLPIGDLPMTSSRKTDHRKMQKWLDAVGYEQLLGKFSVESSPVPLEPAGQKIATFSEAERAMQSIWMEVLKKPGDAIGPNSDFFQLGGDSILAMKAAVLARSRNTKLSVSDIFRYPRLRLLVSNLQAIPADNETASKTYNNHKKGPNEDPNTFDELLGHKIPPSLEIEAVMPATPLQAWFVSRWSRFCFPFIINGPVDVGRLESACQSFVHQRSIMRSVFAWGSSSQLLHVTLRQLKPFPFRHIHVDRSPDTIAHVVAADAERDYVPEIDQIPIQFTLYTQTSQHHLLLVHLSHAQFDGYCLPIIFEELGAAYRNSGTHSVTSQFSDYLRIRDSDAHKQAAITFWTAYLEKSTMTALPIPTVAAEEMNKTTHVSITTTVPKGSTMPFTFPTIVNAAFSLLLSRWSRKQDLVFGLVMNTRDKPGLEHSDSLIGPCLNINPLRLRIHPEWTVNDLCHAARSQFLDMVPYDDLNWSELVAQCTQWPASTECGFILNHLTSFGDQLPLSLGENTSCQQLPMRYRVEVPNQLLIRSILRENHSWELQVLAPSALMDTHVAQSLANRHSQLVHHFYQLPNRPLASL
ncbi:hypothetical protein BDV59DRAFT_175454 [Aspergillus ambiguus]|uniref:uncharacterized protein n=1 Tax=Aspergillus ambiguus TaxID=176160 RepID=UPI003CCD4E04